MRDEGREVKGENASKTLTILGWVLNLLGKELDIHFLYCLDEIPIKTQFICRSFTVVHFRAFHYYPFKAYDEFLGIQFLSILDKRTERDQTVG